MSNIDPGISDATAAAESMVAGPDDLILITGAAGFIGTRVVENLLERGFRTLRCFVRPSSNLAKLTALQDAVRGRAQIEILTGNLLSREDCLAAAEGVAVVYHLAAGRGEKMVADAFMNSVVTTRNLLDACCRQSNLRRILSVSSFSVYSNRNKPGGRLLDESCPVETQPELRGDAYTFAKVKQEEIICEYGDNRGIPYVIVRPGVVYGPGNEAIHARVGINPLGLFLHLGGGNQIPLTYVDNCADAIVLAGLRSGINGEVFNIVDDDLPSSRQFLRLYKKNVGSFKSIYVPHAVSFALCYFWEKYHFWSKGQHPLAYSRRGWHTYWKRTRYSNKKLRSLGWAPRVPTSEALEQHFRSCRKKLRAS
jgi:nucleoside-diphosphate-sugar epimerase